MRIRYSTPSYKIILPLEPIETLNSEHQEIVVGRMGKFGKTLVIDGEPQFSEADQHIYHEMFAYPPALLSGGKDFLILGGGDGLLASVLARFTHPTNITIVDLDQKVVEISKKHFSHLGASVLDEVDLQIGDALNFSTDKRFDVVFVDLVDIHTAPSLYDERAVEHYSSFLKRDGILAFHSDYVYASSLLSAVKGFDHSVSYAAYVPSWISLWTFHLFSKASFDFSRLGDEEGQYYSKDLFWKYSDGKIPVIELEEEFSIED